MILGIIIGIIVIIIIVIFLNLGKDDQDLNDTTLEKKFEVLINILNTAAFNGEGEIKIYDKKHIFLIHPDGGNQKIEFLYSQGMLSITWKYKYFQKELIHRTNLSNVRNLSVFEQQKIGVAINDEMNRKIQHHKNNVWS